MGSRAWRTHVSACTQQPLAHEQAPCLAAGARKGRGLKLSILPAKLACSESPHSKRKEDGGGGVAKPDTLSAEEGPERLHCALASASATKPCRVRAHVT
jgi:hypothetical protein